MQTETMQVTGLMCGGCINKLSLALNETIGVSDVQASLASGEVTVRYDEHQLSIVELEKVVTRTGFGVAGSPPTNGHDPCPSHSG